MSNNGNGFLDGAKAIAAGSDHSIALRANGQIAAWGENLFGQLGNPLFPIMSTVPRLVRNPTNTATLVNAIHLAAGGGHNVIVTDP